MKKFVPLVILALTAISVSISAQNPANTLTAKEKSEGWKLLFDGATLNNFVPQGKAVWEVVDGALRPEVAGGWLATKDDYTNFQLQVDFRPALPTSTAVSSSAAGARTATRTRSATSCRSETRLPVTSLSMVKRATTTPTTPAAFLAI